MHNMKKFVLKYKKKALFGLERGSRNSVVVWDIGLNVKISLINKDLR